MRRLFHHTKTLWLGDCHMTSLIIRLECCKLGNNVNHFLLNKALDSQSIAISSPSPLVADVLKIWKVLFFNASKPRAWWTSATLKHPAMSCLFARTTRIAPCNSSSLKKKKNKSKFNNFLNNAISTTGRNVNWNYSTWRLIV